MPDHATPIVGPDLTTPPRARMFWRGLTRSCAVCGERGLTRRFIILTPSCPRCGFRFEPGEAVVVTQERSPQEG